MPSESAGPLGEGQRLHPLSILFGIGNLLYRLLFPIVAVMFVSRGRSPELLFALFLIPAIVGMVARYLTYRYWITPDEIVIREGVLVRNERHIPFARIQNIDLVRNPLHRMFDVAVARVETASGGKPEAVISVLALDAVEQMRASVFQESQVSGDAVLAGSRVATDDQIAAAPALVRMPFSDLVLFGVISNRGMALVAAALSLIWQSGAFDNLFDEDQIEDWIKNTAWLPDLPGRDSWVWIAAGVLVVLTLAWVLLRLLSVAWAIVKFYGFVLRLIGEDLRADYGLLTRVSATIPRHRIQSLSTKASWLHRKFGRSSVQVQTAGGAADESEGPNIGVRRWLAPLVGSGRVHELIHQVLPEVDLDQVDWQPIAARAWVRVFRVGLVITGVVAAASGLVLGGWAWIVLPIGVALAYVRARLYARYSGWALTAHAVLYRSGWWTRRMSLVLYTKIQALTTDQSPFDRRHDMASLSVDTAGAGRIGHGVQIRYLEVETADRILERLYGEAERRGFRW
jgi:putative membrane protein